MIALSGRWKSRLTYLEEIVGNIFAAILIFIVVLSVLYSLFLLFFRSGEGFASYGSRGEFYMAE